MTINALFLHFFGRGQAKKCGVVIWLALFFSSVILAREPSRTISIKVVADQEFKTWGPWTFDFNNLIKECSLSFSRRFGLNFQVKEYSYLKLDDKKKKLLGLMRELMHNVPQADCDIVLGLLPPSKTRSRYLGVSSYIPSYILLEWTEHRESRKFLLLHELCHMLGAADIAEKGSIMSHTYPGYRFDDFTARAILLNKERLFNPVVFPLPKDRLDEAIALYRSRAKKYPGEGSVHLFLGRLFHERKDWLGMLTEMEKALTLEPDFVHIENLLQDLYFRDEDGSESFKECRKILEARPEFPEIQFNLGLALLKRGIIDEAASMFQRTVESHPRHFQARMQLGNIWLKQGKVDEAIKEFRQAVEISPECAESHLDLATALIFKIQNSSGTWPESDSLHEAVVLSRKAISIKPGSAEGHNILGVALFYSDLEIEAQAEFERTLELEPGHHLACFNLGVICLKNNSLAKAAFHFERALQLRPEFAPAYRALACVYSNQGEMDKYQKYLYQAEKFEVATERKFLGMLRAPLIEKRQQDQARLEK